MRILGIVVMLLGLVILGFGVSSSQAITEEVIEGVSGRYTANTMWYIIGGLTMFLGGGALALFGGNKQ